MEFIKKRVFCCKSRENLYQYYKSHENPYQVLQVMCTASECAMKSKVCMIHKIIITIVPSYTEKSITCLLLLPLLLMLHTHKITDGNKLYSLYTNKKLQVHKCSCVRPSSVLVVLFSKCLKFPNWPLKRPNWAHVTGNFVLGNLGNKSSYNESYRIHKVE